MNQYVGISRPAHSMETEYQTMLCETWTVIFGYTAGVLDSIDSTNLDPLQSWMLYVDASGNHLEYTIEPYGSFMADDLFSLGMQEADMYVTAV